MNKYKIIYVDYLDTSDGFAQTMSIESNDIFEAAIRANMLFPSDGDIEVLGIIGDDEFDREIGEEPHNFNSSCTSCNSSNCSCSNTDCLGCAHSENSFVCEGCKKNNV